MSSSTNTDIDVNINNQKLIEKTIENKFNQVLDKIPSLMNQRNIINYIANLIFMIFIKIL